MNRQRYFFNDFSDYEQLLTFVKHAKAILQYNECMIEMYRDYNPFSYGTSKDFIRLVKLNTWSIFSNCPRDSCSSTRQSTVTTSPKTTPKVSSLRRKRLTFDDASIEAQQNVTTVQNMESTSEKKIIVSTESEIMPQDILSFSVDKKEVSANITRDRRNQSSPRKLNRKETKSESVTDKYMPQENILFISDGKKVKQTISRKRKQLSPMKVNVTATEAQSSDECLPLDHKVIDEAKPVNLEFIPLHDNNLIRSKSGINSLKNLDIENSNPVINVDTKYLKPITQYNETTGNLERDTKENETSGGAVKMPAIVAGKFKGKPSIYEAAVLDVPSADDEKNVDFPKEARASDNQIFTWLTERKPQNIQTSEDEKMHFSAVTKSKLFDTPVAKEQISPSSHDKAAMFPPLLQDSEINITSNRRKKLFKQYKRQRKYPNVVGCTDTMLFKSMPRVIQTSEVLEIETDIHLTTDVSSCESSPITIEDEMLMKSLFDEIIKEKRSKEINCYLNEPIPSSSREERVNRIINSFLPVITTQLLPPHFVSKSIETSSPPSVSKSIETSSHPSVSKSIETSSSPVTGKSIISSSSLVKAKNKRISFYPVEERCIKTGLPLFFANKPGTSSPPVVERISGTSSPLVSPNISRNCSPPFSAVISRNSSPPVSGKISATRSSPASANNSRTSSPPVSANISRHNFSPVSANFNKSSSPPISTALGRNSSSPVSTHVNKTGSSPVSENISTTSVSPVSVKISRTSSSSGSANISRTSFSPVSEKISRTSSPVSENISKNSFSSISANFNKPSSPPVSAVIDRNSSPPVSVIGITSSSPVSAMMGRPRSSPVLANISRTSFSPTSANTNRTSCPSVSANTSRTSSDSVSENTSRTSSPSYSANTSRTSSPSYSANTGRTSSPSYSANTSRYNLSSDSGNANISISDGVNVYGKDQMSNNFSQVSPLTNLCATTLSSSNIKNLDSNSLKNCIKQLNYLISEREICMRSIYNYFIKFEKNLKNLIIHIDNIENVLNNIVILVPDNGIINTFRIIRVSQWTASNYLNKLNSLKSFLKSQLDLWDKWFQQIRKIRSVNKSLMSNDNFSGNMEALQEYEEKLKAKWDMLDNSMPDLESSMTTFLNTADDLEQCVNLFVICLIVVGVLIPSVL